MSSTTEPVYNFFLRYVLSVSFFNFFFLFIYFFFFLWDGLNLILCQQISSLRQFFFLELGLVVALFRVFQLWRKKETIV